MKEYSLGFIVGRFQILHKGHADMIEKAIELCDRVAVMVGSSQEAGTAKNPFDYETRKEFLRMQFGDRIDIHPLPDIGAGNNCRWGDYVMDTVRGIYGEMPDAFISGEEARRISWINPEYGTAVVFVPKSIDISATRMTEYMLEDNRSAWTEYIADGLADQYERIRETVLAVQDKTETRSI